MTGEVELDDIVLDGCDHTIESGALRTEITQQLVRDLHVRRHLTKEVPAWQVLGRGVGISLRTAVDELPVRSAVLPAEIKVLELGLLIALLRVREESKCVRVSASKKVMRETQVPCRN